MSVKKPLFLYYEPERQSYVMYGRNAKSISGNSVVFCGARYSTSVDFPTAEMVCHVAICLIYPGALKIAE
jgi:hypothetical protein